MWGAAGLHFGATAFLAYINDIESATTSNLFLYADDSALVKSGRNPSEIEAFLSEELKSVSDWLVMNKLSLHLGKTESILFASRHNLKKVSNLNVSCNNVEIGSADKVKYLGATLEQDLSGKCMGTSVIKKINAGVKFMYRKAKFLSLREKKMLAASLLQSHFDYACNIWYRSLDKATQKKLQTAQNKVIRCILNMNYTEHVYCSCFKKLKWLNVAMRVKYLTLSLMYKVAYGSAPSYMMDLVRSVGNSRYNTRRSNMAFVLPAVKSRGQTTFTYNGIRLWNNLPNCIKVVESKNLFKSQCKNHLFLEMCTQETSEYTA